MRRTVCRTSIFMPNRRYLRTPKNYTFLERAGKGPHYEDHTELDEKSDPANSLNLYIFGKGIKNPEEMG